MKKYFPFIWLLFAAPIVLFTGCDDDDDAINAYCRANPGDPSCPNYDPCFGVLAADSEFEIIDSFSGVIGDTAIGIPIIANTGSSNTFFRPTQILPNASYAWRVGTDSRVFTETEVNLNFTGYVGNVTVRLEVTVPSSDSCLFEHELVSQSSKTVNFVERALWDVFLVGNFRGTLMEDGVQIDNDLTITYTPWDFANSNNSHRIRELPLPEDCRFNYREGSPGIPMASNYLYAISGIKYEFAWMGNTTSYPASCRARRIVVLAFINPDDTDEMTIDYWFNNDEGKRVYRQFVGRRVE